MKSLLVASALIELGAGFLLLCFPELAVKLLTGEMIGPPATLAVVRLGGAGLFALGIACWTAQLRSNPHTARTMVTAMLAYNISAASILGYAGVAKSLHEPVLWAAVILHTGMTIWCATRLAIKC